MYGAAVHNGDKSDTSPDKLGYAQQNPPENDIEFDLVSRMRSRQ